MTEESDIDRKHMESAIALLNNCRPIADRIPKVGAVIAVGEVVIGEGYRGVGTGDDDDHAEKKAIESVVRRAQLPDAAIYTTLEPCTADVRSDPLKCCTALIKRAGIQRVFIGILDPNQAVTGKGLWELQTNNIDVELFPPRLAQQIRTLNDAFIRSHESLGIQITSVKDGDTVRTYDKGGAYTFEGTFLNPPGDDVFALNNIGGRWWPQPYLLKVEGTKKWSVKCHFGAYGPHSLYIVRANDLGKTLIQFYRKVCVNTKYTSIDMGRLPKGLEPLAKVDFVVETPPSGLSQ